MDSANRFCQLLGLEYESKRPHRGAIKEIQARLDRLRPVGLALGSENYGADTWCERLLAGHSQCD